MDVTVNPDSPMPIPKKYTKTLAEGDEEIHALLVDLEGNVLVYEPYSHHAGRRRRGSAHALGWGIHVRKVKRGRCQLVLPNRDHRILRPTSSIQVQAAKCPLPAGHSINARNWRGHQVEVPTRRSFWLHVNVQPRDPAAQDDKFILRSADRAWKSPTVKDNRKPAMPA